MSKTKTRRSMKGWSKIAKELNIVQEFQEIGVEIAQNHPTAKNYVACWAYDRPQGDSPSAGINIVTGWYKDHGGTAEGLYLYEIRHRMGLAPSVEDALKYYALKVGKIDELSQELFREAYAEDNVETFAGFSMGIPGCARFLQVNPHFTAQTMEDCGAEYAMWPRRSPDPNYCISFRAYDAEGHETGYVLQSIDPRGLLKYRGKDAPPTRHKRLVLGASGIVGRRGLDVAGSDDCELIIKVEGISDMLALQQIIPEELRDRVSVVTNACGSQDVPAQTLGIFRHKHVVVIHDADEPGQRGARLWCTTLLTVTPHVKNVQLYEEIAPDHGRDVRDWINEGGTWGQLHQLINITPNFRPGDEEMSPEIQARMSLGSDATEAEIQDHILLHRLGLLVLGHLEGTNKALCYSSHTTRVFQIDDVSRMKAEVGIMHMGRPFRDLVSLSVEHDPTKYSFSQVRRAIAWKAGQQSLKAEDRMGAGVWRIGDRIVLVNDGEISIANGDMQTSRVPSIGNKVIEFASDPWYVHEEVSELYERTLNRNWCRDVFDEASSVFARWDNWKHEDTPLVLTAMVCATWIQTTLDFRPGVVVTGSTNTGKTMLTQECVSKMFGKQALFVTNPTEAGIRQAIGHTSKTLMIDEFENSKHRQNILDVLRSSTRGTDIVKGTTDHRGTKFHFRHIPWLSSIETGLRSAADRNRYIILELNVLPPGRASTLQIPTVEELELLGKKLLVIGMRYHTAIRELHIELKATSVEGIDRRIVEAYSLPAAVLGAVNGLTLMESQELLRSLLTSRFAADDFEGESDEAGLLEAIAMTSVRTPHGEFSVSKLLTTFAFDVDKNWQDRKITPESCLLNIGIKRTRIDSRQGRVAFAEADAVAIAPNTFRGRLRGTRFEGMNIEEILLRIPTARKARLPFNGARLNAVVIPMNSLLNDEQAPGELPFSGEGEESGSGYEREEGPSSGPGRGDVW